MELLVTLHKKEYIPALSELVDGVLVGCYFSQKFHYSYDEMLDIVDTCKTFGLKVYISIDALISEGDKPELHFYFDLLSKLKIQGIYFSDLSVIDIARSYPIDVPLIYDGDTLMTNSLDAAFFLSMDVEPVLARELTLEETAEILKKYPSKIDMQIFGHLKMSSSKRRFLSNYANRTGKFIPSSPSLRIVEETRNYGFPIEEDDLGTRIYTDYIFLIYEELIPLRKVIKRGIIDDSFIDADLLFDVLRDLNRLAENNAKLLTYSLIRKHPEADFSQGYFYQKTVN